MIEYKNTGNKDTRSGFGEGLLELGRTNKDVVALCADLTGSLKMNEFKNEFPNRFIQVGIAEANMMGIAAGMTIGGKIPFTGTFANFSTGRVYDQIRQSIAYSGKNVKICASHAGITLGEDGATHQILEDIGLMKMLPGMTVINTCDFNQTKAATLEISKHNGPVYLRFGRPKVPNFTDLNQKFEIGKGVKLLEGNDVTIVSTGHLVWESIIAAKELSKEGIEAEVINIHTIKPLDEDIILKCAIEHDLIVTVEENVIAGGAGSACAEVLSAQPDTMLKKTGLCQLYHLGLPDKHIDHGDPKELLRLQGLDAENILSKIENLCNLSS